MEYSTNSTKLIPADSALIVSNASKTSSLVAKLVASTSLFCDWIDFVS